MESLVDRWKRLAADGLPEEVGRAPRGRPEVLGRHTNSSLALIDGARRFPYSSMACAKRERERMGCHQRRNLS